MTNTEETLAEVTVEEEVQALNTQPSGRPARHIDDNKADKELSEFHERAISECGIGRFHWMLLAACGMGLAADTAELLVLGFVLPSAEVDFCISQTEKRVLGVVTYTGLATGALLWGCMADRVGRRRTLLTAMTLAAIFDLMAALMPTFGTFLTARLLGGIGLGGSLPILIAYFSEFIPRPQRVKFLCALLACWAFGGIYVALMAWAILPKTGVMVVLDGQEHFSAWHIFLIVCAIPTPLAVIGLLALPESPRILLQIGHESEALVIYQVRTYFGSLISKIFAANHRRATLPIIVTWVFASFGYYGLSLWFPEYVKYLKGQDFKLKASTLMNVSYSDIQFNQSIENMIYVNGRFTNVRFQNLILNHVVFDSCHFEQVSFIKIKSSRSLFRNSTILQSTFVDTDFFPYRFEGCHMEDTTFDSMDAFCPLDFDYNIHLGEVFLEQLIGELSLIPGLVLAALLMDRFGRARLISISLLLCSLLTLTLAAVQSPEAVIGVEAAFNVFFAVGLASLTVASTETCPTYIRATGWGLINTLSRGAGLAGLFVYDSMLECTVLASCFVTSGVMLTSAVVSLLIIETRHTLL
ncbi:hypothetical protein DAPPUDRAFT_65198 [Daphnia pulex]|uniref:Major facilitator superfamily (MFS) profile domain-containing protein n=1 Tax=Daphnia pulex TaxID=6669 RepID=E9HR40_DAPPU|nr:hypothetical protein DAPPUDRAFT_65198 [Daphnia pulex]|eukprot:EFX65790.1 hypothetical protein DAPPUDRAFT_65198 [Daphnia pulex]